MAQSIVLKRSALSGKVPGTSSLSLGEIAINTYDGRVFFKASGSVESVQHILTTNSITTGSITLTKTGSFGELVVTQDGNFQRDIFVTRDIVGNGDLDILGSLTASIQQGYVWVGNASGKTSPVATSSFGTSLSSLNTYTASLITAFTASGVDVTFNGNQLIKGALSIGTSSLGSNENTLVIGPAPAGGAGEGGQILLQAKGDAGYTSASMLDNWQNFTRLLRGSNQSSDAVVTQWNMHTKQVSFPAYNSVSAFAGTAVANLAVDSGGSIITVSTSGGSVFPYIGTAVINGGVIVTGSITSSGVIYAQPNGGMYFQGGDDAALYDINVANTMGIYGVQDSTIGSVKLGSGGGTISGKNGNIGIGTIEPTSGTLHVNGNIFATSLTGSIAATNGVVSGSSQVVGILSSLNIYTGSNDTKWTTLTNVTSSILAFTSSQETKNTTLLNVTSSLISRTGSYATTGSNTFIGNQLITGSTTITGSLIVVGPVSASNFTGSLLGTASYASNADLLDGVHLASLATTGSNTFIGTQTISGSLNISNSQFNSTSSATATGTTTVSSIATGSFTSIFYNYTIASESNARSGQIMSVWSGSTIRYSEVATTDIGNTSTATFAVAISGLNVNLNFSATGVWRVKSIANLL